MLIYDHIQIYDDQITTSYRATRSAEMPHPDEVLLSSRMHTVGSAADDSTHATAVAAAAVELGSSTVIGNELMHP